jgi:predicted XRE-type DNA-binding protein
MKNQKFESVWDAIEDTAADAANMKLRAALMIEIERHIKREGLSQAAAAKLFGVTQPRISDLVRGKVDLFGLDALVNMVSMIGVSLELRSAKTRRSPKASPGGSSRKAARAPELAAA